MKPREEYDKEALLVFADLEQKIGRRNLLFARRNIFLILLYILCCVEFTLKRFRGEKKKKKKKKRFKKKCGTVNSAKRRRRRRRRLSKKMSGDGGGVVVTDEWAPLKRPLLFLGAVSLFASIVSYRKKQTNLFKMSYASTCVTLGPATVLFALPERDEKLEAMLLKNQKRRNDTEEMLAEMRRVAASSPAKGEKSR
jgi:hypothetical protein